MAKLRKNKAVNMKKVIEFIPVDERQYDDPLTLKLKPLSYNQRERCAALATDSFDLTKVDNPEIKDSFKLVNSATQAARFALVDWMNLIDDDGDLVEFPGVTEYEGAKQEALDLLGFETVQEVGQFVLGNNKADEDDLKN